MAMIFIVESSKITRSHIINLIIAWHEINISGVLFWEKKLFSSNAFFSDSEFK